MSALLAWYKRARDGLVVPSLLQQWDVAELNDLGACPTNAAHCTRCLIERSYWVFLQRTCSGARPRSLVECRLLRSTLEPSSRPPPNSASSGALIQPLGFLPTSYPTPCPSSVLAKRFSRLIFPWLWMSVSRASSCSTDRWASSRH